MNNTKEQAGLSRRDFLKVSGITLAALAVAFKDGFQINEETEITAAGAWGRAVLAVMPQTWEEIKRFEEVMNHKVQIVSWFTNMNDFGTDLNKVETAAKEGRLTMFNWGGDDELDKKALTGIAKQIRSMGIPIYLRPDYEMNGNWFSWGNKPETHKLNWCNRWDIFRQAGTKNVRWIWSPSNWLRGFALESFYPGNEYVDIAGADVYNNHREWPWELWHWVYWDKTSAQLLDPVTDSLKQIAGNKPLILGELGIAREWGKEEKATKAMESAIRMGYRAVNYFQFDKEVDWRLNVEQSKELRDLAEQGAWLNNEATIAEIDQTILGPKPSSEFAG